jgi:hypothetical protein
MSAWVTAVWATPLVRLVTLLVCIVVSCALALILSCLGVLPVYI